MSLWFKADINVKEVSVHAGHTSVAFALDRIRQLELDPSVDYPGPSKVRRRARLSQNG
jgi:hypothetical protein